MRIEFWSSKVSLILKVKGHPPLYHHSPRFEGKACRLLYSSLRILPMAMVFPSSRRVRRPNWGTSSKASQQISRANWGQPNTIHQSDQGRYLLSVVIALTHLHPDGNQSPLPSIPWPLLDLSCGLIHHRQQVRNAAFLFGRMNVHHRLEPETINHHDHKDQRGSIMSHPSIYSLPRCEDGPSLGQVDQSQLALETIHSLAWRLY